MRSVSPKEDAILSFNLPGYQYSILVCQQSSTGKSIVSKRILFFSFILASIAECIASKNVDPDGNMII